MNQNGKKNSPSKFSTAVGRSLRRAAKGRAQNGAYAWDSHLRLEERQSRRGETVIDVDFGVVVGHLFKAMPQLIEELKKRRGTWNTITTKNLARRSRNQTPEYLAQSSQRPPS